MHIDRLISQVLNSPAIWLVGGVVIIVVAVLVARNGDKGGRH